MSRNKFTVVLVVLGVLLMSNSPFSFDRFIRVRLTTSSVFFIPPSQSTEVKTEEIEGATESSRFAAPVFSQELRDLKSESLEGQLRAKINSNLRWRQLVASQRMSVGVVNMVNEEAVAYAALNGQTMLYAASLPKIAVLAAAHDAMERGELQERPEIKADLRMMIAKSNNAATTRMIDRIGFEHIERTMTDPRYKLYDPEFGGGLWVGKRYAAGGRRYPDPIKGLSHAATAEQVCRFFYLLANDALLSPESSSKMKAYLVNPELHHKFVNTLDRVAPTATVYRKSGSWENFHADVALVQGPGRNYIITALVDDEDGEQICRELAYVLDELLREQQLP